MDIVIVVSNLLSLVVGIMLIVAILRIFAIHGLLKDVLNQLRKMDENRREEFEAMAEAEG